MTFQIVKEEKQAINKGRLLILQAEIQNKAKKESVKGIDLIDS